jgi:hypothetical protein
MSVFGVKPHNFYDRTRKVHSASREIWEQERMSTERFPEDLKSYALVETHSLKSTVHFNWKPIGKCCDKILVNFDFLKCFEFYGIMVKLAKKIFNSEIGSSEHSISDS